MSVLHKLSRYMNSYFCMGEGQFEDKLCFLHIHYMYHIFREFSKNRIVQWGSKYWTCLVFERQNVTGLGIFGFQAMIWIPMEFYAMHMAGQQFVFLYRLMLLIPCSPTSSGKSSAWKLSRSSWKWYYSFSREIFSFGEFFKSKHFFKNCGPCCTRGPNWTWGWQTILFNVQMGGGICGIWMLLGGIFLGGLFYQQPPNCR